MEQLKARNKIFVKPDEKVQQVGHILLAEKAQSTVEKGTIVYCPEGLDIKVGDRVVYDKALTIAFEDLLVLDEADVWATIGEEE